MGRKVVKVYLPVQIRDIFEDLCDALGLSESETTRLAIFELADKYGLVAKKIKDSIILEKNP